MKRKFNLLFLLSWAIAAFGQPARLGWLGAVAAVCGYALFFAALPAEWDRRRRFAAGTAWFAAVQLVQLSWMTSIEFQGYYILFVYAFLAAWLGAQFGLLALCVPKEGPVPFSRMLSCTALWTLMEWSRQHILCGFSWNPIGLALSHFTLSLQTASVWGVFGLSFWAMLTNLACLDAWRTRRFTGAAALAAAPYLIGAVLLKEGPEKNIDAAIVQTALFPPEKSPHPGRLHEFISPYEQWRRVLEGLQKEGKGAWDWIVFPEAFVPMQAEAAYYPYEAARDTLVRAMGSEIERAFPPLQAPFAKEQEYLGTKVLCVSNLFWCQTLANHYRAEVVAGLDHSEADKSYNSAFYFKPGGLQAERYDKRVLLPLAEYVPFDFLRTLTKSYGIHNFFTPGEKAVVLGERIPFSPSICYEETFPETMREGRAKGACLFINVTNDNYYPDSSLHAQHLFHARLRAVENGVPLLRACNAGVSAAVDAEGRIQAAEQERQLKILSVRLNAADKQTLFSRWGDAPLIAICVFIILIQAGARARTRVRGG